MTITPERVRSRLEAIGVSLSDEEWAALPAPARRRLSTHPTDSEVERHSLRELARWMVRTFPPGWSQDR